MKETDHLILKNMETKLRLEKIHLSHQHEQPKTSFFLLFLLLGHYSLLLSLSCVGGLHCILYLFDSIDPNPKFNTIAYNPRSSFVGKNILSTWKLQKAIMIFIFSIFTFYFRKIQANPKNTSTAVMCSFEPSFSKLFFFSTTFLAHIQQCSQ